MSKNFQTIDSQLKSWAKKYGLFLYTQYKDEDIRSFVINTDNKGQYQIWIDDLGNQKYSVNIWDYKKRKKSLSGTKENMKAMLDEGYQIIQDWIKI